MLIQTSNLYTPIIFEAFQGEYERSMVACTTALDGNNCYLMAIGSLEENFTFEKEYKVFDDPLEQTSTCSCGLFGRTGILCGHALKVLDMMKYQNHTWKTLQWRKIFILILLCPWKKYQNHTWPSILSLRC